MNRNSKAKIGILCWEAGLVSKGLQQLEKLKGNSTNPESYDYPVLIRRVKGASAQTIVIQPDENVLNAMVEEMKVMISMGVEAITTSCGFNAIHQKRLAKSVNVPVFTSSIMQVPFVWHTLGPNQSVGVITSRKKYLTAEHFRNAGVSEDIPVHVIGMDDCPEWNSKVYQSSEEDLDPKAIEKEMISVALKALKHHPDIGAFVLECTDMPPFAPAIRQATRLPVFDFISMVNYVYQAL